MGVMWEGFPDLGSTSHRVQGDEAPCSQMLGAGESGESAMELLVWD